MKTPQPPVNKFTRELKLKYNDLRPYIKSGVLQEKIDELFNWFAIQVTSLVVERTHQTRTEERNKVIEVAIKAAKQYQIDQLVGSAIPIVVNEAFYKQLLNYDLDKLNQLKGEK